MLCVDKIPPMIGGVVQGAITVHAGTSPVAVANYAVETNTSGVKT